MVSETLDYAIDVLHCNKQWKSFSLFALVYLWSVHYIRRLYAVFFDVK